MTLLTQIGTGGIKDNAITTAKVAADAVTQPKIGAGAVGTTEIADNAVLTGKIQDGTLTTADLTDNAINSAKIASDAVTAAKIPANAIGSSEIDLTAAYTFTGSFSTPNGFKLLATRSDSSAVNYNSDTVILDFASEKANYRAFYYIMDFMPTSGGNYHLYMRFRETAAGSNITGRTICNGRTDNNANNSPDTGSGDIIRLFYQAAGPGVAGHIQGYVFNGKRSDADYDAGSNGNTNYHYSGVGQATNTYSFMASGGASNGIGAILLNLDGVGHSNDMLGKVEAKVWGIS